MLIIYVQIVGKIYILFRIRNVHAVVFLLAAILEMIIRFLVKHFVWHAKNPLIRLIRLTPPSDMMMRADQ